MKSTKRIAMMLMLTMCLSVIGSPAYGAALEYKSAGNKAYALDPKGMSMLDAFIMSSGEIAVNLAGGMPPMTLEELAEARLTEEIENVIKAIPGGKEVLLTYKVLDATKYAFWDFGVAMSQYSDAKKELMQSSHDLSANCIKAIETLQTSAYERGVKDRFSDKEIPYAALENFDRLVEKNYKLIEVIKNNGNITKFFIFKDKELKKITNEIADDLTAATKACLKAETYYKLGRWGDANWDYEANKVTTPTTPTPIAPTTPTEKPVEQEKPSAAFSVPTDTKVQLVNQGDGKNFNVYTEASASRVTDGTKVSTYVATGNDTQDFKFSQNSNGSYTISLNAGSKVVDTYNTGSGVAKAGATIHMWSKNNAAHDQQWLLKEHNGALMICLNADPSLAITVGGNGFMTLQSATGASSQLWAINSGGGNTNTPPPVSAPTGYFTTSQIDEVMRNNGIRVGEYWAYDSKVAGAANQYTSSQKSANTDSSSAEQRWGAYDHYGYKFGKAWECVGFGRYIGYKLTGSTPSLDSEWKRYTSVKDVQAVGGLQVGDYLFTSGHTAVVYAVDGNRVTFLECWGARNNLIQIGPFNGQYSTLESIPGLSAVYRYQP